MDSLLAAGSCGANTVVGKPGGPPVGDVFPLPPRSRLHL